MPYIDFEEDSNYYRGKRSVELFKKKTGNNVDIDVCSAVLNNSLLEPNSCRIKWTSDPENVYKFRTTWGDPNSIEGDPTWSDLDSLTHIETSIEIDEGVSDEFLDVEEDNGVASWTKKYVNSPGEFCILKPSISLSPPSPVFLTMDRSISDEFCGNSSRDIMLSDITYEFGQKFDPTARGVAFSPGVTPVTRTRDFGFHYIKLREQFRAEVSQRWLNGQMIAVFDMFVSMKTIDVQIFRIIPYSNGVSLEYGNWGLQPHLNPWLNESHGYSLTKVYTSANRKSTFYKSITSKHTEVMSLFSERSQHSMSSNVSATPIRNFPPIDIPPIISVPTPSGIYIP